MMVDYQLNGVQQPTGLVAVRASTPQLVCSSIDTFDNAHIILF